MMTREGYAKGKVVGTVMGQIVVSVITLAVIALLVLWLIMQPQKRVLQISVPVCALSFAFIYLFYLGTLLGTDDPAFGIPIAFQAFIEAFSSFSGGVSYGDLSESGLFEGIVGTLWFETAFWAFQMIVIVTLAISGFAAFGRKVMDRVRLKLITFMGRREVYHIFGDTQGALLLGENLSKEDGRPFIVFYSTNYTEELREDIAAFGGALIEVDDESIEELIQKAKATHPGNVAVFKAKDHVRVNGDLVSMLLARKIVHDHAPYKALDQAGGFPTRPYEAFIIGFGELGQACAKQIIESAQLSPQGIRPKLYIVDKEPIELERFQIENPLVNLYADITYLDMNVYSFAFRDFLMSTLESDARCDAMYVACAPVSATNSAENTLHIERNMRVIEYVKGILARTGLYDARELEKMFVSPCVECTDIWTSSIILHKNLDTRAIRMNGSYAFSPDEMARWSAEEKKAQFFERWEDERKTSEFNKDSSRAACDFIDTMIEIAGIDPSSPDAGARFADALENDESLLTDLSRIEHERWCAFHACNGYTPMSMDEFAARTNRRVDAEKNGEADLICPHHDAFTKRHACLVSWEDLPDLEGLYSRYDKKIANGVTTLQGRDADNVTGIPALL